MSRSRIFSVFMIFALMPCCLCSVAAEPVRSRKVLVEYFYQPGCHECDLIRSLVLPRVEERFSGLYELRSYDIGGKDNFLRLAAYQESLAIKGNEPVTMVVQGKISLSGYNEIKEGIGDAIDDALSCLQNTEGSSQGLPPDLKEDGSVLERRAGKMTVAAIVLAGLVDGINPCAFSTLVFFMSLLAVAKVRSGKLLAVGLAYCGASFISYAALGFGLFRSLKMLDAYPMFQRGFNLLMVAALLILAALSFRDAFRYRRGGRADDVSLQLPERVKSLMHSAMRLGLGYRWLVLGAFAVGVAVTALESICTGQTYIPVLTLLAKDSGMASRWIFLILLYNCMFIVPLLFVIAAAYMGTGTPRLLEWSRRNVVPAKMLLGLLFLALAAMIAVL